MSTTVSGLLQLTALVLVLAAVYVPLGDYMARVYTSDRDLFAERVF